MARPTEYQESYYNGHKRKHALKYQAVTTPDGIIVHMFGPSVGRSHDNHILNTSGFLDILRTHFSEYCLFGDPAYPRYPFLLSTYSSRELLEDPSRAEFNVIMSSVRVTVEWGFKDILKNFSFLK